MSKKECFDLFKGCCIDFWGEEKTPQAIIEAWNEWLSVLREEGEEVPAFKLTKEEVKQLMSC